MKIAIFTKFILMTCLVVVLGLVLPVAGAFAQQSTPAAIPTTPEPATATSTAAPTNTPQPGTTSTPIPSSTPTAAPPTSVPTFTPTAVPSRPVPIPEPVTVVLFGTGLAALSAAVASRRKKDS